MKTLQILIDKLYLKQWNIGIAKMNIRDLIRDRTMNLGFLWFELENNNKFYADPFIFKSSIKEYSIFFEEYDYKNQYGKISIFTINHNFDIIKRRIAIDTKSHLSYPNIFIEDGKVYVFPEASKSEKLAVYQYDYYSQRLIFKKDIINLPLIDSTILKYKNKYWIFSTMLEHGEKENLYIHYSKNLFGPYSPHGQNPQKNNIGILRPAGSFINVDGILYRPSQNSEKYYGSSININKIILLNENKYIEEKYMTITPDKTNHFNMGIHTINYVDNIIVIDGVRKTFLPLTQFIIFVRKKFRLIKMNFGNGSRGDKYRNLIKNLGI